MPERVSVRSGPRCLQAASFPPTSFCVHTTGALQSCLRTFGPHSQVHPSHFTNCWPLRSSSDLGEYTPTSSQRQPGPSVQVIPGSQIPGWPQREERVMCLGWAYPHDPTKSLLYKIKENPYGALDYFLCVWLIQSL